MVCPPNPDRSNKVIIPVKERQNLNQVLEMKNQQTYCPSNDNGGFTIHLCGSVELDKSTTHNETSGLRVPGVGYLTVFDAGNVPPLSRPDAVKIVVDENHGYSISPTLVSLKAAYMICVPSGEPQTASSDWNISSVTKERKKGKKHDKLFSILYIFTQ